MNLLLALACAGSDFPKEWHLDRTRVLAVRSTPAEPQPGDWVSFEALTWSPGMGWHVIEVEVE